MMIRVALALMLLGATAGVVARYLRHRPGVPLVFHQLVRGLAIFVVAIPAFVLGERLSDAAFGNPSAAGPTTTLVYGGGGIWLFLAAVILYQRARAGRLLLDLGPAPKRAVYVLVTSLFVLLGVLGLRDGGPEGPFWLGAALWSAMQIGRLQIREAGIWKSDGLIRWPDIAGYTAEESGTVRLQARHCIVKPKLRVPEARREEFFQVLKERAALSAAVVGCGD